MGESEADRKRRALYQAVGLNPDASPEERRRSFKKAGLKPPASREEAYRNMLRFMDGNVDGLLISFALSCMMDGWDRARIARVVDEAKSNESDHEHVIKTLARASRSEALH
jgi:hypothetical protein